jgi:hypothetical protein
MAERRWVMRTARVGVRATRAGRERAFGVVAVGGGCAGLAVGYEP